MELKDKIYKMIDESEEFECSHHYSRVVNLLEEVIDDILNDRQDYEIKWLSDWIDNHLTAQGIAWTTIIQTSRHFLFILPGEDGCNNLYIDNECFFYDYFAEKNNPNFQRVYRLVRLIQRLDPVPATSC